MKATNHATVLMYHRLSDVEVDPEEGDYVVSPASFEAQMSRLAADGRDVAGLTAVLEGTCGPGAVVLTFDDGCDSDARVALPILRRFGLTAAFFVNPARVGDAGRLSWDEVGALLAAGMHVGSHGLDHTLLDGLSEAELERQLGESKRILETRLGVPIETLSLPGGSGGERALAVARQVGYRLVFGSQPGRLGAPLPFCAPRFAVRRGLGLGGFSALVAQDPRSRWVQTLRYRAMRLMRGALGTERYARLRREWLSGGR